MPSLSNRKDMEMMANLKDRLEHSVQSPEMVLAEWWRLEKLRVFHNKSYVGGKDTATFKADDIGLENRSTDSKSGQTTVDLHT